MKKPSMEPTLYIGDGQIAPIDISAMTTAYTIKSYLDFKVDTSYQIKVGEQIRLDLGGETYTLKVTEIEEITHGDSGSTYRITSVLEEK